MIHYFQMLGKNIVLDVYSGAVHVLDDVAYDMVSLFKDCFLDSESCPKKIFAMLSSRYEKKQIEGAYRELRSLRDAGLLYTQDTYAQYAKQLEKRSVVKALCLHIAHDCNLRCKYCFASTGSFKGNRSLMSADVGKKAIDFVIARSGNRKNIEIDYFGGEPLLNFGVVKQITEYAKEQGKKHQKQFRFTITTNGILLDEEKKRYINENMSNVVLSIDGTKQVNDRMRTRADGSGCYDTIVPKFLDLAHSRGHDNYYVRGTFTAYNLDFAKDVLHLADLGFIQTSVEPVVADKGSDFALKEEHLPKIFSEYEKLAKEYVRRRKEGNGFNFFHFMIDLTQGPCVIKRISGCGSGHEYVAVTPEGDIYPCHQFVGVKQFKMGSVLDNTFDEAIKQQFQKSNIYTKPACEHCFAKFYCSGGCPANAYMFNGDINQPYELACKMQRKRVECSLAIAAALADQ